MAQEMQLIKSAQSGDESAKEKLIVLHRSYIKDVASNYCKRRLDWDNDDELSIALLAFNEAMDSYDLSSQKSFKNFAGMVIRSRLIDFFRKEVRHDYVSLESNTTETHENEERSNIIENQIALDHYKKHLSINERAEEISSFEELLKDYGITFEALEKISPKHQKTRDKLVYVATYIKNHQAFLNYLKTRKKLPLNELVLATKISKKTLKRGRKYIIAVTLILMDERFNYLRSFFALPSDQSHPVYGDNKIDCNLSKEDETIE